ncbi:MAG: TauD/TfdA family dioxygenase, partial [Betaproteobacteria bacterium]
MKLAIRPIQGEFCAEVIGADLTRPMDDATFSEIERAWTRHSILVFRDARMSPEQHIAFTRRFGPLHIMEPLQYNLAGHP